MNGIKEIFGKEMARVFKDKKMVFSVFLLPVVIMVAIFAIIDNLSQNMMDDIEEHTSIVYMINEPESFKNFLETMDVECDVKTVTDMDKAKDEIKEGTADLIVEFPENFETDVENYQDGAEVPQIKTYYNPSEEYSSSAFQEISGTVLEAYRQALLSQRVGNLDNIAVFRVNSDNPDMVIQDEMKASGKALGMMLPYLITILLFAGAMGLGTDMIAGEKERGTMASLLVTPVKRSNIVLGKVFALMVISGISSVIYVAAMIAAMPMMSSGESMNFQINLTQGLMLGALLVALAFLYSAIIALISVFAKTVKEANTYVTPAYMVVLVVGLFTMFSTKAADFTSYCIPLYNSALAMKEILTQEITMVEYGITLGMTVLVGVALCGVIVKAFESEKVMSL